MFSSQKQMRCSCSALSNILSLFWKGTREGVTAKLLLAFERSRGWMSFSSSDEEEKSPGLFCSSGVRVGKESFSTGSTVSIIQTKLIQWKLVDMDSPNRKNLAVVLLGGSGHESSASRLIFFTVSWLFSAKINKIRGLQLLRKNLWKQEIAHFYSVVSITQVT